MTYLVVYESAFGNTRAVAEAVAAGLGEGTEVLDVGSAPPLQDLDVDLLVLGGPTHAFGMSRPQTREDAAGRGGHPPSRGIREWLDDAEGALLRVATFDTHTRKPNFPGTAGKAAAKKLRSLGCTLVAEPEKFWVHGDKGPLLDGEVDRAREWAQSLL